jgi:hypothetical protein
MIDAIRDGTNETREVLFLSGSLCTDTTTDEKQRSRLHRNPNDFSPEVLPGLTFDQVSTVVVSRTAIGQDRLGALDLEIWPSAGNYL